MESYVVVPRFFLYEAWLEGRWGKSWAAILSGGKLGKSGRYFGTWFSSAISSDRLIIALYKNVT